MAGILDDREIADITADVVACFDRVCSLVTYTLTPDGRGGNRRSETVTPNIPCLIMPEVLTPRLDLSERNKAGQIYSATGWIFTLPPTVRPLAADVLRVVGTAGTIENYEVTATLDYPKSHNLVTRVIATILR